MIKVEIEEMFNFSKIFWNYQKQGSFRNESLHNGVYKLLVLIIATKLRTI
nr:hypothetical protein [Mycoplasmopsis bovis]